MGESAETGPASKPPVDTFVGRDPLMARLRSALAEGRNLVLVGPRRVGKSELPERMAMPGPGQPKVFVLRVTVEGRTTQDGGIAAIDDVLSRLSPAARADVALSGVKKLDTPIGSVELSGASGSDWAKVVDRLEGYRRGLGDGAILTVALDEVPWWLEALERREAGAARQALAQLRSLRDGGQWPSVRWILTGSVGLAGRAAAWGAAKELNDLDLVEVPPLDASDARHMLRLMVTKTPTEMTDAAGDRAWVLAGGRPHWIRLLGELARVHSVVHVAEIDAAAAKLVGRQHRHLFNHEGQTHFDEQYPAEQRVLAAHVLDLLAGENRPLLEAGVVTAVLARSTAGTSRSAVRDVLDRLLDEFYLVESGDGQTLRLALPLFGMWWTRWGR